MRVKSEVSGVIRLVGDGEEVLVHSVPKGISKKMEISVPPTLHENSSLKSVFDVVSLDAALALVREAGGVVKGQTFSFDGLTRLDVLDPEGNITPLRRREP